PSHSAISLLSLHDALPILWCSWLVDVHTGSTRSGDHEVRAFMVRLPSGVRYWTVLDEELAVVQVADSFLRQVRFGRDGAESTTKDRKSTRLNSSHGSISYA